MLFWCVWRCVPKVNLVNSFISFYLLAKILQCIPLLSVFQFTWHNVGPNTQGSSAGKIQSRRPVSQHVVCLLNPPALCQSEFYCLPKNHWTPWRKCVQPERRVGNASIHLFIFLQNNFGGNHAKRWQVHNWVITTVKTDLQIFVIFVI